MRVAEQDLEKLKAETDLLALVRHDTSVEYRGKTDGGEYKGPCPKCGGDDRFIVQPKASPFPRWTCRQCLGGDGHLNWRDAPGYIRWRDGADFVTACKTLLPDIELVDEDGTRVAKPKRTPPPVDPPDAAWQTRARRLLGYASQELWGNEAALRYLREGRGLDDDTIRLAGLGYVPHEWPRSKTGWGTVPRGWVFPCALGGVLWWIRVRRHGADVDKGLQRWHLLEGSVCKGILFGADVLGDCPDVVICEGAPDALLLRQHINAMADVVALGGASTHVGIEARRLLIGKRIVAALDDDDAGENARRGWDKAAVHAMPTAHDVTDMWRAGQDLAAWIMPHLGPRDPGGRGAWLEAHLRRLDAEGQGESAAWAALLAEYDATRSDAGGALC